MANTSGITSRSAYWAEEKAKTGDKLKLLQRGGIKGIRTVRVDRRWAGTTHGSHPESSSLVSKSEFKSQTGIKYEITDHNVTTFDRVFESRLAFVNWIWFSYHLHTMTTFSTLQYDIYLNPWTMAHVSTCPGHTSSLQWCETHRQTLLRYRLYFCRRTDGCDGRVVRGCEPAAC